MNARKMVLPPVGVRGTRENAPPPVSAGPGLKELPVQKKSVSLGLPEPLRAYLYGFANKSGE